VSEESERIGGWSVATLHEHLVKVIDERDRLYAERWSATQRASERAARDLDGRLEKLNEFRGALADAQTRMVTKTEFAAHLEGAEGRFANMANVVATKLNAEIYEVQHVDLAHRVELLESWRTSINARVGVFLFIVLIAGSALGVLVGHVFSK